MTVRRERAVVAMLTGRAGNEGDVLELWIRTGTGAVLLRFCLALLVLSPGLFAAASDTGPPVADRAAYGPAGSPLWSPLTPFEQQVLVDFERARSGNPDALLALYLVASGDVRTQAEFDAIRRAVRDVVPRFDPRVRPRERGEHLLSVMFQHYLSDPGGNNILARYRAEESRLSAVLREGYFNCISSAMLYIVLARYAELDVEAALLPSHAFVVLKLPGGESVSIETTSVQGFDARHDPAWFEEVDAQWYRERDLPVPSVADYAAREPMGAAALGVFNMSNQHAKRLTHDHRLRLAEIQAYLSPDSVSAQHNRLVYYHREVSHLHTLGDVPTLHRFMQQTAGWRTATAKALQHFDGTTLALWYGLELHRAELMVADGRGEQGAEIALAVLDALSPAINDEAALRHNAHVVLGSYLQQAVAGDGLERAAELLSDLPHLCGADETCHRVLAHLHNALAMRHWADSDWGGAILRMRSYLALGTPEEFRANVRENLESAWMNWAQQSWHDELRDTALAQLQRCIDELAPAPRCRQRLQAYRAAY